jgi:hypothetical protein
MQPNTAEAPTVATPGQCTNETVSTGNRTTIVLIVTVLIILGGIVLRARGMTRSLWLDEAWVANSTLEKSFIETLYYPAWLQTSPPGFLILVRWTNCLFGLSNASLRVVPFVSGVAALICMAYLSFRLLSPLAATWSVALFSFAPLSIYYSHTLKQYGLELTCSTVLLIAVWSYLSQPSSGKYCLLLVLVCASLLTAYGIFSFLPGLFVLLSPYFRDDENQLSYESATSRWWVILGTALVTASVLFLVVIRPNRSDDLKLFWMHPRLHDTYSLLRHSYNRAEVMMQTPFSVTLRTLPLWLRFLLTSSPLVVFCGIIRSLGPCRRRRFLVLMCGCPCLVALFLDLLNLYPVADKFILILLPCVVLPLGFCFDVINCKIREKLSGETNRHLTARAKRYTALVSWVLIACTCGIGLWDTVRSKDETIEDMDGAVRYLSRESSPSDFVFVHSSCEEALRLYARMYQWQFPSTVKFGDTGWPCCARSRRVGIPDKDAAVRDFLSKFSPNSNGKVWLLATGRIVHWQFIRLDESDVVKSLLLSSGCQELSVKRFTNVRLELFLCNRNSMASVRSLDTEKKEESQSFR